MAHAVGQGAGKQLGMQTRSGTATCGEVELFYEDLGDPAAPPVLLIMGVGAQLPMWPDGFCEQLVKRGYRVIRFDHRDIGLSTKMEGHRAEGSVYRRVARYAVGRRSPVPYTLVDLADDAKALLDHLQIDRAHLRRGVDGRNDRAGAGRQPSGPRAVAGHHHVEFR